MTELKTLKDFDPEPCCYGINQRELKAEAIREVKEILNSKGDKTTLFGRTHFAEGWLAIVDYIIQKNNLTEADIK